MRIEFYDKTTQQTVNASLGGDYFVDEFGQVWQDNEDYVESSSAVTKIDSFLEARPNIGWRI